MKALATFAAVLAISGSAMAQWTDDFNRADGPIGGPWNILSGTWAIQSQQGAHTSASPNELIQHNAAAATYTSVTAKLDVFGPGTASQFSALVIGMGGNDMIMVKLQNQAAVPGFSNIGIYHNPNGAGWSAWTGTGTGFAALTVPGFTSAELKVYFSTPDILVAEIDTNFDGIPDQTYTKDGVLTIAANLGMGQGIAGWGATALFDDFDVNGMPTAPGNDNCATASPLFIGVTGGDTTLATNDGSSSCDATGNDVWWSYTDTGLGGVLTLDTCGSAIDTVLSVYDTCGGTLIACDDNGAACGSGAAALSLTLNPNDSIVIRVSDKGVTGGFTLNSTFAANVPGQCNGSVLSTLYATNNQGSPGGQLFFDINVTKAGGITVAQLQTNSGLVAGSTFGMDVYTIPGTYVGNEQNSGAWTLSALGTGVAAGLDQPSLVEFTDFMLPAGSYGVALVAIGTEHRYTNGTGANQLFSNADLTITLGAALNVPWTGAPFTPRVWNGAVIYDCGGGISTYCTPGTSTNGCLPAMSWTGTPSISATSGFTLDVSNVEGQKQGLFFYGISGQLIQPWGMSSSFLCIKSPVQRLSNQNTNGTLNACDGAASQDWLSFLAANPTAVGVPFTSGTTVDAQFWYRDPPSPKTTMLSDGLEFTTLP